VPVKRTRNEHGRDGTSAQGKLPQVVVTFVRVPTPSGPAWSDAGSASSGWLEVGRTTTTDVSPSLLAFAPQIEAIRSAAQTVTVSNIGTGDLHVASVGLDNVQNYQLAADGCTGATVPAGLSCGVDIIFDPMVLGPTHATLTVTDDAPGLHTATITGTGLSRSDGLLSPGKLTFGEQGVTTSSPPQTVTLTSIGPDPLGQISVAESPNFAIAADNCSATTVAVGSTCTIGVSFHPYGGGRSNATLTVSYNASDSPQTVALSGGSTPRRFSARIVWAVSSSIWSATTSATTSASTWRSSTMSSP